MALLSDFERINNTLAKLHQSFGVRNDLDPKTTRWLFNIFERCKRNGKFSDFVREIKLLFNLPMSFRLQYKYNRNLHDLPDFIRDLAIRSFQDPTEWAARVTIPSYLPLYGNPSLENFKLKIEIKKALKYESFDSFFYCISHEMSHVLLKLIRPELWEDEEATDLLIMIMGFSKIVKRGSKSSISGHSYGYLSKEMLSFAYRKIRKMQKENSFFGRKIVKIRKVLNL